MRITKFMRWLAFGCAAVAAIAISTQAFAIDLKGKTVEWVIPFSETGGSAKWAHFYAPLLSEALPGQPTVGGQVHAGSRFDQRCKLVPEAEIQGWDRHFRLIGIDPVPIPSR